MAEQTIKIADKPTVDEILALLKSTEIGLVVLKTMLGDSAGTAEETMAGLQEIDNVVSTVAGYLSNNTYGLNAIKNGITGRANESTVSAVKTLLENGTYGLNALKNAVSGRANETTVAAVKSLLENGTYGLSALKTLINTANTNVLAFKDNTFKEIRYGVLQINTSYVPSVPGTTSSSQKIYAYSGELSITGNGKITFYNAPNFANTFSNNTLKLTDVTIDGCTISNEKDYVVDGFTLFLNQSGRNSNDKLISLEFSKSFKCKLAYFGNTTNTSGNSIAAKTCTDSASYFVQLR